MTTPPAPAAAARRPPQDGARCLVVVGPADSYRLGAYLRAARRLAVPTVVVTDRPSALGAGSGARCTDLAAYDPAVLAGLAPLAVVATDAEALAFAAAASAAFGLRANPPAAVAAARDKIAQRRAVAAAGLPQPRFRTLLPRAAQPALDQAAAPGSDLRGDQEHDHERDAADAALAVGLPVVVKPRAASASHGVLRADDPLDARAAAALIRDLVGPQEVLLVERFIAGGEVAVEGLLDDGELHVLAIFDKPDAPQGPTFPETVLITPSRLPAERQRRLAATSAAVCAAIGLTQGPVHIEFRIDEAGRPWFLELAARTVGGRCATMLHFAGEVDLEELVLRQALGMPFDPAPAPGSVGVMMLPTLRSGVVRAIEGVDELAAIDAISEVNIDVTVGDVVYALPRADRYAGFVFARAERPETVESALAKAAATLRLVIEPERTVPLSMDFSTD